MVSHPEKKLKLHHIIDRATKVTNMDRAKEYFDIAYPPVYGTRWPSIRLALSSKQKYVAVVNNFANHEVTVEKFQELGAMDIRHKYSYFAERLRARKEEINEKKSQEGEEDTSQDEDGPKNSKLIRTSLLELDDDALAARANAEPISRYPEEYRRRALAQDHVPGTAELDYISRIILPSEVGSAGISAMMDYVPATKLKGLEDWIEETDVFLDASQGDQDIGLQIEKQEEPINLPSMLKIYAFNKTDISDFPKPKMDHHMKLLDYYALDGASLLPVLALDLAPGDRVLDLCAAPGGKTLIALQSLLPGVVVSNDISDSRVQRIRGVLRQYIPNNFSGFENVSVVKKSNGCDFKEKEAYDKVLVDAPCLIDRVSMQEDDNSIFKTTRTKERLKLPELQSQLLVSALQAVRPGGTVVYSTCTLSPLQNDGVVHLALSRIWQETTIECSVVDMTYAVRSLSFLYRFGNNLGLRYGQVVLPSLLSNFGPMYCAKIRRLK
ncbi:5-methylcytosine rRNA methyltransferase NSUN4-like isoform X2 [Homarus americanus]|uniref:5-methylcytosine rRNA methyltransferase NSUN4-like isoform X2 n=1 Tax=Homarus americanus TaxID=6706 RepID=UPI001C447C8A|nr:5-methylcytosine rRNA methyltransferase NSUN4-like isoform X2 [Homarus americanus]